MTLSLAAITVDCRNAMTVVTFWSQVFNLPVDQGEPGPSPFFASINRTDAQAGKPTMMFIQVPEEKSVKNRMHLDLAADDRGAEVERLIGLGATHIHDKDEWGISWTTLADPEGNEFCVAEH